ncbi:MAG TPA: CPBP family intramembrane glutamic endopeptidase [Blastocatellia bacterium]|nr:CPBP family intramembrane glutamic endopeptidase [Blastocatellia bacterium]
MSTELTHTCLCCGHVLTDDERSGLTSLCASCQSQAPTGGGSSPVAASPPPWNLAAAIGVWVFFTLTLSIVPAFGVLVWAHKAGVNPFSPDLISNPRALIVQIGMLFVTHLLTLLVGYMVVTSGAKRPFFHTLGWRWHPRFRLRHVLALIGGLYLILYLLSLVVPHGETDFDKLLQTGQDVRIAIALVAVLTAPLVEELVYRGILYPALHHRLGRVRAILIVTAMFAVVHFPQYAGSLLILMAVTVLSFALTVIRSYTGQLLPCVVAHFLYNAIGSALILSGYVIS